LEYEMPAYLLVDLDIQDVEGFQEYRSRVPEFIANHGGEYPVPGGKFEVIEGGWQPHRLALFKFPDRQSNRTSSPTRTLRKWRLLGTARQRPSP
jgi:uncharacterized protein (DUF1330 family)